MSAWAPLLSILATVLAVLPQLAGASSVRWYVTYQSLDESGNSLNIGDAAYTMNLRGKWRCHIAPTSKELPAYEARETVCENGGKKFEFSVQCEPQQKSDHIQIRFRDAQNRAIDFIETGCKWSE